MKRNPVARRSPLLTAVAAVSLALSSWVCAASPGTAFTYQGRLSAGGAPAQGAYDLRFTLHDALVNGHAVGGVLTNSATPVSNGVFSVALDFGMVFDGSARWLEISVRTNGGGPFTTLNPRQALTPAPYAVYASNAGTAIGVNTGAVDAAAIQAGAVDSSKIATGQVVKSLNGLRDDVSLTPGANITLATNGGHLQIASTGGGGIPLLNGLGTNTAFTTTKASQALIVTNLTDWLYGGASPWSNRLALAFQVTPGTKPGLWWAESPQANMGIWYYANHDGFGNPEMIIESSGTIALGMHLLQVGVRNSHQPSTVKMQGRGVSYRALSGSTNLEESIPVLFSAQYYTNGAWRNSGSGMAEWSPALAYRAVDTEGNGELGLYSRYPDANNNWSSIDTNYVQLQHSFVIGPTPRFRYAGGLQGRKAIRAYPAQAVPLDFKLEQCVDITLLAAEHTFYTTNTAGSPTNYEQRVFILRAPSGTVSNLAWPGGWSWLTTVPAQITEGGLVRLRLESIGIGESNILAHAESAADHTMALDAEPEAFITREALLPRRSGPR